MRALEHLLKATRDAAVFNPEVQVTLACILRLDRERVDAYRFDQVEKRAMQAKEEQT